MISSQKYLHAINPFDKVTERKISWKLIKLALFDADRILPSLIRFDIQKKKIPYLK